jgi:O-antigen chain-terminating methyltransferase
MLETQNPEIDINRLLEKVGLELKIRQKCRQDKKAEGQPVTLEFNDPYSWGQLSETLKVSELNANAGAEVTSMLHYRGIIRKIARFVGKVTLYFGRVITIPQRNFNSSILHSLRIMLDGIRDMNRDTARLHYQMKHLDQRLRENDQRLQEKAAIIDYLKTGLVTQERRISILLEELRRQVTVSPDSFSNAIGSSSVPDLLDPLYLAFENQFRGTREEIRERLLEYVPRIRKSGAGAEGREVLDIGCGRGEWLGIMADEGLTARGVDLNHVLVQECRDRGFRVEKNDALTYLRSLPDNSIGAITSFHLIEHLDLESRIALFDESVRVLKPGGIALFETPNPRNLLVGSCNFWADPTHLRPLYPETHRFLMEYRGFCKVELLFLHPHEQEQCLPSGEAPELAGRLNEIFSCARDYTIVGYKV